MRVILSNSRLGLITLSSYELIYLSYDFVRCEGEMYICWEEAKEKWAGLLNSPPLFFFGVTSAWTYGLSNSSIREEQSGVITWTWPYLIASSSSKYKNWTRPISSQPYINPHLIKWTWCDCPFLRKDTIHLGNFVYLLVWNS